MTTTGNDPVMDYMKRTIERNTLRYHVGQSISCPNCGAIMDCSRAVELTVYGQNDDAEATKPRILACYCVCAKCHDEKLGAMIDESVEKALARAAAKGIPSIAWVERLDGRILFARAPSVKRQRKPAKPASVPVASTVES